MKTSPQPLRPPTVVPPPTVKPTAGNPAASAPTANPVAAPAETSAAGSPKPVTASAAKPASFAHGSSAAAAGASAAAAVVPVVDAVVHGRFGQDDLRAAAQKSTTGVVLAGAGAYAEEAAKKILEGLGATGHAARAGGAGVAGAAINLGVSIAQNREGLARGDSHAIGRVAGDVLVASGAAIAGAEAGAAIGSIVPGAGTVVGAAVGFATGYVADQILRSGGVDTLIGNGVSTLLDAVKHR